MSRTRTSRHHGAEINKHARETVQAAKEVRERVWRSWHGHRADEVLDLLRLRPDAFRFETLALIRAGAYRQLGHLDTALWFLKSASEKRPRHPLLEFEIASLLIDLARFDEALQRVRMFAADPSSPPSILLTAALVLWTCVELRERLSDEALIREAARIAERALSVTPDSVAEVPTIRAGGFMILALAYRQLGEQVKALRASEAGLAIDPTNAALQVIRGLLLIESRPNEAMNAFKEAIRQRVPIVPPYIFLANFQLNNSDFLGLRATSQTALQDLKLDKKLHASFTALNAISQFELGAPLKMVDRLFRAALDEDPTNARIHQIYARYEKASRLRSRAQRGPTTWTDAEVTEQTHDLRRIHVPFTRSHNMRLNESLALVS